MVDDADEIAALEVGTEGGAGAGVRDALVIAIAGGGAESLRKKELLYGCCEISESFALVFDEVVELDICRDSQEEKEKGEEEEGGRRTCGTMGNHRK